MDKETRKKLEEPFDAKYIRTRKSGRGGPELKYLEGAQYIQRFNDATEGDWSYVIVDRFVTPRAQKDRQGRVISDLVVVVEVRAFGQVRQAFGGSITPAGECLGDDWKGALTDALKKAIASFGVALDLYTKGELAREGDDGSVDEEERGVTHDQLRELTNATKAAGFEPEKVSARSLELFGAEPASLTYGQAAELIRRVKAAGASRNGKRDAA